MTADDYIARVLSVLPEATPLREQIALELRGTIAERLASGQTLDAALAQLGDPTRLAESYLSAVPLVAGCFFPRVLARLVDFAIATAAVAPVAIAFLLTGDPRYLPWLPILGLFVGTLAVVVYPIVAEARYGKTVGKHLFGLRVVGESGARISAGQAVVRNLPLLLQIFWIDALFALFTDRRQRAFELLAKTRVVRAGFTRSAAP